MTSYTSTPYSPTIGYIQPGSIYVYYPPDNAVAVSPVSITGRSTVVMAENASIEWGTLGNSTTLGNVFQQTLNNFFKPLSPYGQIFDPRVLYDNVNNRFIVIADETNNSLSKSNLLVAVSKDANPADGWYFQSINARVTYAPRTGTWADYPTVAIDGSNIIISTNQFTSSGLFMGAYQYTLGDFTGTGGGLYAGGASNVTAAPWNSNFYSVQEVSAAASGPASGSYGVSYIGYAPSVASDVLSVAFRRSDGTTQTYPISLGNIDAGTTSSYTAPQPGSTWKLDAGDGRVTSAAYSNGKLFAVFEVNTGTNAAPVPVVHWVELDTTKLGTSTAVLAQGNITLAGATTFNPSIAVDANGDVIINFTASGSSLYATDYFSVMLSGGTSFSDPVPYQASASVAYAQGSNGISRWGDYSSAIADPNNPAGFWLSNEYTTGSSSWATVLNEVTIGSGTLSFLYSSGTTITGTGGSTVSPALPTGDTPDRLLAISDLLEGGLAVNGLWPGSAQPAGAISHNELFAPSYHQTSLLSGQTDQSLFAWHHGG